MAVSARIAVGLALVTLAATPLAGATSARDALIRPGEGIGKLRLGMSLKESRAALGQPIQFESARSVSRGTLRYLQYGSRDGVWRIALLGRRGSEKLVSISTDSRRERLRNGVGVGTLVSTLPERLRTLDPKCVAGEAFLNSRVFPVGAITCAITTGRALTIFFGDAECAVPTIRYQGCPEIRVPVVTVPVEGPELTRVRLSAWDPDPSP
ncbi:MAG: hypothetical protein MSC30_01015 [Gaiellaceae bacterium MAG52_C11]|nr:hypothetical protein [Candidatus Gaiellasilicea maunaloa]